MKAQKARATTLATVATLLAMAACYGTLAIVGLLGLLGIGIALNETIWAGAIVTFALLAVIGLGIGAYRHRASFPVLLGLAGTCVIAYALLIDYNRLTELGGFALLCLGAFADWRKRRGQGPTCPR